MEKYTDTVELLYVDCGDIKSVYALKKDGTKIPVPNADIYKLRKLLGFPKMREIHFTEV